MGKVMFDDDWEEFQARADNESEFWASRAFCSGCQLCIEPAPDRASRYCRRVDDWVAPDDMDGWCPWTQRETCHGCDYLMTPPSDMKAPGYCLAMDEFVDTDQDAAEWCEEFRPFDA